MGSHFKLLLRLLQVKAAAGRPLLRMHLLFSLFFSRLFTISPIMNHFYYLPQQQQRQQHTNRSIQFGSHESHVKSPT
jgi:hypothetical protein